MEFGGRRDSHRRAMTSGMEQRAAETPPAQQSRPVQRQQQPSQQQSLPPPPPQQQHQHQQPAGATVARSTEPHSDDWSSPEFFTDWGDFDPHLVL